MEAQYRFFIGLHFTEVTLTEFTYFSKIYYHRKFQDPTLSGSSDKDSTKTECRLDSYDSGQSPVMGSCEPW